MKKRILRILLKLVKVVALLPNGKVKNAQTEGKIIEVDGTKITLAEAFGKAKDGDTIKLTANIHLGSKGIRFHKTSTAIILDLNNFTITYNGSGNAIRLFSAGLTITDSSSVKGGMVSVDSNSIAICNGSSGNVTISGSINAHIPYTNKYRLTSRKVFNRTANLDM